MNGISFIRVFLTALVLMLLLVYGLPVQADTREKTVIAADNLPGQDNWSVTYEHGQNMLFGLYSQVDSYSLKIKQESWFEEAYRQGDEVIVAASLQAGGRRYIKEPWFSVTDFRVVFEYEDGKRHNITLFDSGDLNKHGDVSANDGIWSNRIRLNHAGIANVFITARGTFRNIDFTRNLGIGQVVVNKPGKVVFYDPDESSLFFTTGQEIILPLKVKNYSAQEETVYIELNESQGRVTPGFVTLTPEQSLGLMLEIDTRQGSQAGVYGVTLLFEPHHSFTTVQPGQMEIKYNIVSRRVMILRSLEPYNRAFVLTGIAAGVLVFIFIFLGALFYFLKARPLGMIDGIFLYGNKGESAGKPVTVRDGRKAVERILIKIGPPEEDADLNLDVSEGAYTITIIPAWQSRLPKIIRGWQALFTRQPRSLVLVICTLPGVIEYKEGVYSKILMQPGDEFVSGSYYFRYVTLPSGEEKIAEAEQLAEASNMVEINADENC